MIINMIYVGIDPGLHGALVAITTKKIISIRDTPTVAVKKGKKTKNEYLVGAIVASLRKFPCDRTIVALEHVHAMPMQGTVSMWNFGRGLGLWEGIIAALGFRLERVTPQKWKKSFGLGQDKNASIVKANELYPSYAKYFSRKKDEGRAEALLIAHWLKTQHDSR